MRKNKWLRALVLFSGALVVLLSVSGLLSCADAGSGGGGGSGAVDPRGTWLVVLDETTEGPTGVEFQAALAEVNDTQFTIIFYGMNADQEDTVQVAGLRGSYAVDGDSVDCYMNIGWFQEDPQDPPDENAPVLVDEWTGIDWYQVEEGMALSVTIDGTTLYGGGEGEIPFEKVSFFRPLDLIDTWEMGNDDLVLNGGGSFTYTYSEQSGGGDRWEVTTLGEGYYMRQVYNNIPDEESLEYKEYLSPYEMMDADTLHMYRTFAMADDPWIYTRATQD